MKSLKYWVHTVWTLTVIAFVVVLSTTVLVSSFVVMFIFDKLFGVNNKYSEFVDNKFTVPVMDRILNDMDYVVGYNIKLFEDKENS